MSFVQHPVREGIWRAALQATLWNRSFSIFVNRCAFSLKVPMFLCHVVNYRMFTCNWVCACGGEDTEKQDIPEAVASSEAQSHCSSCCQVGLSGSSNYQCLHRFLIGRYKLSRFLANHTRTDLGRTSTEGESTCPINSVPTALAYF